MGIPTLNRDLLNAIDAATDGPAEALDALAYLCAVIAERLPDRSETAHAILVSGLVDSAGARCAEAAGMLRFNAMAEE